MVDVIPQADGSCTTQTIAGNGYRARVNFPGPAPWAFEAEYRAQLTVAQAGQITFNLYTDDGWVLAIDALRRPGPARRDGRRAGPRHAHRLRRADQPAAVTQNYMAGGPSTADTNVTEHTAYDVLGRTTVQTDAVGAVTQYGYDALGDTIAITNPVGRVS
jgi:YD repeat-containing protein